MVRYKIRQIIAREMLDSRGNPTVEVTAATQEAWASVLVPSGASTGIHEALELRDGGKRYHGKGVLKACNNVNKSIAKKIIGMDVRKQLDIDEAMIHLDGTYNKAKLGANAILGVSMAVTKLAATALQVPLFEYLHNLAAINNRKMIMPVPCMNIINGGKHAEGGLDFQECMLLPTGAKTFRESVQIGSEIYHTLKDKITKKYGASAAHVGDEGGFAPSIKDINEALALITDSAQELGYKSKIKIGIDAAASEFYNKEKDRYMIAGVEKQGMDLIDMYKALVRSHPLISIEDPFDQDDNKNFYVLTKEIGRKAQIVGDDLLVTNPGRIKRAVKAETCNALLLKVNQIGTMTEALDSAAIALGNKFNVMVSHRSGETEDSFIAELAVALGCGQIKSGAPCRGERTAKYNQLMRIEEAGRFKYAGIKAF